MTSIKKGSFPGKRDTEAIEFYIRRHYFAILVPLLILLALGLLLLFGFSYWRDFLEENLSMDANLLFLLLFTATFLLIIHMVYVKCINHFLRVTVITSSRIVDMRCTSVLSRGRDVVELERIQDMRVVQNGILRRLFNFGSIEIHDASGHKIFTFRYVAKPQKYFNTINHIYKKALQRKNVTHV